MALICWVRVNTCVFLPCVKPGLRLRLHSSRLAACKTLANQATWLEQRSANTGARAVRVCVCDPFSPQSSAQVAAKRWDAA